MVVVGIDPSLTALGIAAHDDTATIVGRYRTKPGAGDLVDVADRIRFLVGSSLAFVPKRIDLTVIEAPLHPRSGAGGQQLERAWLFGFLVDQFLRRGPVVQVRAKTRAKYASGSGNADKAQVLAAVREAFPNIPLRDDNESDALALCSMGARHLGAPIDGEATKAQLQAMAAVRWPVIA